MPRRGENIRKRKDGRWEARYIDYYTKEGTAHYRSVYGRGYTEVKQKLKLEHANEKRTEKIPMHKYKSLSQLSQEYLEHMKAKIKEASYSRYSFLVDKHILPSLGKLDLRAITEETMTEFVKALSASGKLDSSGGLAPKTVKDIFNLLIAILKYGKKKGYLQQVYSDISLPTENKKEVNTMSEVAYEKLYRALLIDITPEKLGIFIALLTGIRIGELCALKWEDICLEEGTVSITKTLQRIQCKGEDYLKGSEKSSGKTKIIITTPKSKKSIRTIPLPAFSIELLKTQKNKYSTCAYILTGSEKYMEPRLCQKRYKKLLQEANIAYVSFHTLRHTFASRAVEFGFEIKSLSEVLGHSTVRFTLDRYVHSSTKNKRRNMEKLYTHIRGQNSGSTTAEIPILSAFSA